MPPTPSSASSRLNDRLKNLKPETGRTKPLWSGPCDPGPMGGITFSLLSRFLTCRERFRVHVIEGIRTVEQFNHRMDYGTMWHLCEEELAEHGVCTFLKLEQYAQSLIKKFRFDQEKIEGWYNVCRVQFPIYVEHWAKHPDVTERTPLMQEQVFQVPYILPNGRVVYLRGKFDSVDLIGSGKDAGIYLQENKTKGDIDIQLIQRQLTFDLQTNLYLIALIIGEDKTPIKGVRYNVVRRPLSGGKGNIKRGEGTSGSKCPKCKGQGSIPLTRAICPKCKGNGRVNAKPAESWADYYKRLEQVIRDDTDYYFSRWKVEVAKGDIQRFRNECLDPILMNLAHWYDHVSGHCDPTEATYGIPPSNWRHPFGAANTLDEYGHSDLDEYLNNKSMAGLRRIDDLFGELR